MVKKFIKEYNNRRTNSPKGLRVLFVLTAIFLPLAMVFFKTSLYHYFLNILLELEGPGAYMIYFESYLICFFIFLIPFEIILQIIGYRKTIKN